MVCRWLARILWGSGWWGQEQEAFDRPPDPRRSPPAAERYVVGCGFLIDRRGVVGAVDDQTPFIYSEQVDGRSMGQLCEM